MKTTTKKRRRKVKSFEERREHKRFLVMEEAYAIIAPKPKIGQIVNISNGGLALRYMVFDDRACQPIEDEVYLGSNAFCLEKIPFTTVTDFKIPNDTSFKSVTLRQRCIQFGELSMDQESMLLNFLSNNTVGEA